MPTGVHYDGSYLLPSQQGEVKVASLEETRGSRIYKVRYHWLFSELRKKENRVNYMSKGPAGSPMEGLPLVDRAEPDDLGGGVCEYEDTFAEVPKPHSMPEGYSVRYQYVAGATSVDASVPVTSIVTYTYFHQAKPESIPCTAPGRFVSQAGNLIRIGPSNNLVESETVEQWRGFIWRKKSRTWTPPKAVVLP